MPIFAFLTKDVMPGLNFNNQMLSAESTFDKIRGFVSRQAVFLLLAAYAFAGLLTVFLFDGTGDDGDSITHYLFARYAPAHPELYFDHWAKPVFVILSSPFAQFGFSGMKFFNLSVSLLTFYLTYRTAERLRIANALLAIVFLVFTPLYYVLTFSGLTEPLFALFLAGAVFLVVHRANLAAAILVSFMPFVRSEGLIIAGVFGLWFIWSKQWKCLPLLATGHLVFSLAGFFVYHDLLWVIRKIPYATLDSSYGSGPLLHFTFQMNYVLGVPLLGLFVAGLAGYFVHFIKKTGQVKAPEAILVLFGFFAFFIAHSLFWYFGLFNSMGLKRVLLGVIPLMALVMLRGYNLITVELTGNRVLIRNILATVILAYTILFPFTRNPAAIRWDSEMRLTGGQKIAGAIANYMRENPMPAGRLLFNYPYLNVTLHADPFNHERFPGLSAASLNEMQMGDLVIWDNWFSVVESGVTLETVEQTPGLRQVITFKSHEQRRDTRFVIFAKDF